jgi:menaquinone-dependent protoporphyrinogen oxidase
MKQILVAFATREGHAERIAEHVAETLRDHGWTAEVVDVAHLSAAFDLSPYGGVVLAASVHLGRHEREMVRFVKSHHAALERVPTAFLSVSLSEAGVEDANAPFDKRAKAAEDVKRMIEAFCHETGLHPSRVWPVAGALTFSEYGALKRFVMARIARAEGITDVEHDHDLTDWRALDYFVARMLEDVGAGSSPRA